MLNIFSRNLWQAWCFICWYCCGECLCWEQEQVCILSCIFLCKMMQRLDIKLYFYFLIRYNNFIYTRYFHLSFPFFQHQALGNNPTNSVVIPQSLMFEFCFHQWKYFFFFCPWRFLVFFDDGFAQYLPVKKLHHVYHTGIKCLRVYNI